jgi:hypothetical protein
MRDPPGSERERERERRRAGSVSVLTGWAGSAAARSWAPGAAQLDVASSFLFFYSVFLFFFLQFLFCCLKELHFFDLNKSKFVHFLNM